MRSHCVYFLREVEFPDGPVKIGNSHFAGLTDRLSRLQCGNWRELQVVAYIFANSKKEAELYEAHYQAKFAEHRIIVTREWFNSCRGIEELIQEAIVSSGVVDVGVSVRSPGRPRKLKSQPAKLPELTRLFVCACLVASGKKIIRAGHPWGAYFFNNKHLWLNHPVGRHKHLAPWNEVIDWINHPEWTKTKHKQVLKEFEILDSNGELNEDGINKLEEIEEWFDETGCDEADYFGYSPRFINDAS